MKSVFILLLMANTLWGLTGQEIVDAVDRNLTFNEGEMNIAMIDIKNGRVSKELFANIVFKKNSGTLMVFTKPAREKNKKVLMVKDNMWMFVPGISRPVRLSAKDSFMGSSLSNRDLMDFDMNNDYRAAILESTEKQYKLELLASNKNVSYARIILYVDREKLLPLKQELYTVSGNMIKTMEFTDVRDIGGKLRPSVFVIKDALTRGSETRVVIEDMKSRAVNPGVFSPQNIGR